MFPRENAKVLLETQFFSSPELRCFVDYILSLLLLLFPSNIYFIQLSKCQLMNIENITRNEKKFKKQISDCIRNIGNWLLFLTPKIEEHNMKTEFIDLIESIHLTFTNIDRKKKTQQALCRVYKYTHRKNAQFSSRFFQQVNCPLTWRVN